MRWFKFVLPYDRAGLLCSASAHLRKRPITRTSAARQTDEEIRAWNIDIGPAGKELPPGSGTAKEGAQIFAAKCSLCHGPTAEGHASCSSPRRRARNPKHASARAHHRQLLALRNDRLGLHQSRHATQQRRLAQPDEVYSLTAFILFRNGIVQENDVIDAKTLPKVKMPNRDGFLPPHLEDIADLQKRGCDCRATAPRTLRGRLLDCITPGVYSLNCTHLSQSCSK